MLSADSTRRGSHAAAQDVYQPVRTQNDAEDGVARKEETGKAKKEVYGCGERGHG